MFFINQESEKEQMFQEFLKFSPNLQINSFVNKIDLQQTLNKMCASASRGSVFDNETLEELLERIFQQYGNLTIGNFIDVHLQAVDIIRFRINQSRANCEQLTDFISQLQIQIKDLIKDDHLQKDDNGLFVILQKITLRGQLMSNSLKIRIFNESLNIDQTLPFQNQIGVYFIDLKAQPIAIDSLVQAFQIEIFDDQRDFGIAQLNVFQMSIKESNEFEIPIAFDSKDSLLSLEIQGNLSVQNLQYAREDLIQLQNINASMQEDFKGLQEQYQTLNLPFSQSLPVKQHHVPAPPRSANESFNSQQIKGKQHYQLMNQTPTPGSNYQPQNDYYNQKNHADSFQSQNQKPANIAVGGSRSHSAFDQDENDDCDLSSQQLIRKTHLILIVHLLCAVLFCVKRSMFLDVTISAAYICAIIRMDLVSDQKRAQISKVFSCFFVFSVILDLVWLIVCFSGWSNNDSSDDKGAQNVVRLVLLGGSLLFLVYKILTAIAVIYLQNSIAINAPIVKQQFLNLLGSESQSNPHVVAAPAQQIPPSIIY